MRHAGMAEAASPGQRSKYKFRRAQWPRGGHRGLRAGHRRRGVWGGVRRWPTPSWAFSTFDSGVLLFKIRES